MNLALAMHNQKKYEQSAQEFADFLTRHPKSELVESARFHRAQALFHKGDFSAAADAYEEVVIGKGPLAETASFDKALAIYRSGQLKKAADAFIDSARNYPQSDRAGKARLYAGTCLYESADYEGAILQFDALIQSRNPVAPDEAKYWKGQALLKLNRPAEAACHVRRGHPVAPGEQPAGRPQAGPGGRPAGPGQAAGGRPRSTRTSPSASRRLPAPSGPSTTPPWPCTTPSNTRNR